MSEAFINLRNIAFAYDSSRPVLNGVDLTVREGDRIGLVGANGSGKTTLLHIVVGLLHPTDGEIEAFGRMRCEEKDFVEVRQRAGLLFQDPEDQLFCPTVAEDVAFGPLNLGKSREEALDIVADTLAALGLSDYADRITYKLSGGEKRLVSLATVLAMKPDVLLLDEPVSGLDEPTQERLVEILNGLPQAMVVVAHDRDFLQRVTGKAVRLHGGKLGPYDLAASCVIA